MDNATRSERSRAAAIQAALKIIARDGPNRLTLDAIAREGGISKGGLMHQFPTKAAVVKALLQHRIDHMQAFTQRFLQEAGTIDEPALASQIAVMQEAAIGKNPATLAVLGVLAEEPGLLGTVRDDDAKFLAGLKAEAADAEIATLRWAAARGLAITAILGMCPMDEDERRRLFDCLADSERWASFSKDRQKRDALPKSRGSQAKRLRSNSSSRSA